MAKRKKIMESYVTLFVLLFLVIGFMILLIQMPRNNMEWLKCADVSAQLPNVHALDTMVNDSENLILVNKTHGLPADYEPDDMRLVKNRASNRPEKYQKLRPEAADYFDQMTAAAKADGLTILMTTGYRSYSYQKELYNSYINRNGSNWTESYSAKPGYSEHQTGLAADVSCAAVGYKLTPAFANTPESKWLNENAHKYGFIIRYQKGKDDITGYQYEPWHVRYVGVKHATEIYNSNLTLEEYLREI